MTGPSQNQLILFPSNCNFSSAPLRGNTEILGKQNKLYPSSAVINVFPGFPQVTFPVHIPPVACSHSFTGSYVFFCFFFCLLAISFTILFQNAPVSLLLGEVGFLAEHRRINVAITRARRHLSIVADSETVSHDDFLKSLVQYMSSEGEVRSAHEYLQDSLPTAVGSYTHEHSEDLLTQTTRYYKKKNALKAKKATVPKEIDSKDELKVVDAVETSEAEKPSQQEHLNVSRESLVVSEKISAKPVIKEINEPQLSSSNTAKTKYSRETLEKEIADFIQDGSKSELSFPKTLNSQQRFDVHSIAEKLSLCHESRGEGKERYIVVRKAKAASKGMFMDSVSSLILHGKVKK